MRRYVDAYVGRCVAALEPGVTLVDGDGAHGLIADANDRPVRLLITDDRALGLVTSRVLPARNGKVKVLQAADRCLDLLLGDPAWARTASPETLMESTDLTTLPDAPLPPGLTLRDVRRRESDPGVPLEDALALVARAEPELTIPMTTIAAELRALPAGVHLFAAVDGGGTVRATSGAAVADGHADVLFVDTDPDWRGRGVGSAMTAHALRDAVARGARAALIDATDDGARIYRRLGFAELAVATRFDLVVEGTRDDG